MAKRILILVLVPVVSLFVGCQSTSHKAHRGGSRSVAAADTFDSHFGRDSRDQLWDRFDSAFDRVITDYDAASDKAAYIEGIQGAELDPFNATGLLILKRAVHYIAEVDRVLAEYHQECLGLRVSDPLAECRQIQEHPSYTKLWASRMIYERQLDRMFYFYVRMLDVANWENRRSGPPVLEETQPILDRYPNAAEFANAMIQTWDANLRAYLAQERPLLNLLNFDLIVDVFERREEARKLFDSSYTPLNIEDEYLPFLKMYDGSYAVLKDGMTEAEVT
ncbi:MAG: hypothetical protein AAF203_04935, partial [Pseudomonadota bacterium]